MAIVSPAFHRKRSPLPAPKSFWPCPRAGRSTSSFPESVSSEPDCNRSFQLFVLQELLLVDLLHVSPAQGSVNQSGIAERQVTGTPATDHRHLDQLPMGERSFE